MDNGHAVRITEETHYPWDGRVRLTLHPDARAKFTVKVRIPGWARNQAVDSDLYRFIDNPEEPVTFKVNGNAVPLKLDRGYASVAKTWKDGDAIELNLPMPVRRVEANDAVKADRGRVALQRGPIVYCIESPDNGNDVRS